MDKKHKIPVVCLAPTSGEAFNIFNPNDWTGKSKAIIQSCSTELSVLHYESSNIVKMCDSPEKHCLSHLENLKRSMDNPEGFLHKTAFYAQVPEIHVFIKAFFASLKGLLDLIVQLLSSEKIVKTELDGFHRKKGIYGGSVINALSNNTSAAKKQIASDINELISAHKEKWIDGAIQSRDLLVHPAEGIHQLMFEMVLESNKNELILINIIPPFVGKKAIDKYAETQISNMEEFCKPFLKIVSSGSTT